MTITFRTDIAGAVDLRQYVLWGFDDNKSARPLIDAIDAAIRAENEREKEALES